MFRPGAGTWKEFGLNNTGNYTIFPFWMFTLLWAILSYVFATLSAIFFASIAMPASGNNAITIQPISSAPALPKIPEIPTILTEAPAAQAAWPAAQAAQAAQAAPSVPGYYILQPSANGMQYVYFGTTPPTLNNLVANSR